MGGTVLLVAHSEAREGRVVPLLAERGCEVEWRCPRDGERLPEDHDRYAGAVVFGGAQSANDAPAAPYMQHELDWIAGFVAAGRPFLGICLGGQLLARALGARVQPHPAAMNEIGYFPIAPTAAGRELFAGLSRVYHWHKEGFELPAGCELLATGETFTNQAFRYGRHAYGLQFHPEVTPAVMRRWLGTVTDGLRRPGAQPAEAQLADSERYDRPMHDWFARFLGRWLADGGTAG